MEKKSEKIAVLGPKYTFSHLAAIGYFGKDKDFLICKRRNNAIGEIVEKVISGKAHYGVVPFWNTGRHYIHIVQESIVNSKTIGIVDNFSMRIRLNLLTKVKNKKQIQNVYTIKHVYDQCDKWLSRKLPNAKHKEAASTTIGVELSLLDPYGAAIASRESAKVYGTQILESNIHDKNNETLFFVIQQKPALIRKSTNFTLIVYPLTDYAGTRARVQSLLLKHLCRLSQEWPIKLGSKNKKWQFTELDGHHNDMHIKSFFSDLKRAISDARILGGYETSISDRLQDAYLPNLRRKK